MESDNVPKGFEKFKLFKDLINDIALLVKSLEQNLKNRLKQNNASNSIPKGNLGKSSIWSGIKKFWPFKGVSEACRPSLSEYIENKAKINKFADEIVFEIVGKLNLIEQYQNISDIVDKFKKDVGNVFIKYSKVLQPEYDREVENLVKRTGTPDPISDKELEDAHKSRSTVPDKREVQDESENLDVLMKKIIENGIFDFKDKESIKKILGEYFSEETLYKIQNYAKMTHGKKLLDSGGVDVERNIITPKWFEVINKNDKNREEFSKNFPVAEVSTEEYNKFVVNLLTKKPEEMSDLERLQYTLLTSDENDPNYKAFMVQLIKHPSEK